MTNHSYVSSRNEQLLYVSQPLEKPVITLENYTKWYAPQVIHPDGTVVEVNGRILSEVIDKYPDALWIDHCFSPRFLYRLAQHLDYFIDERAIEVALGRLIIEKNVNLSWEVCLPPEDGPEIVEV